jgi:ubiquinone/menaquinone biosynthesis C-methylase UbiE
MSEASIQPAGAGKHQGGHTLVIVLVVGLALALIFLLHGAVWWYAPLAFVGLVLAHVLVFGGLVFAARHSSGGHQHSHEASMLLHRPRQYDRLARTIMLGREAKLRGWTLDLADVQPGHAILDVGCGTGTLLVAAAERVGPSGAAHGIERSPEMLAHARDKARARGTAVELIEGSADELPYPAASFDAVLCTLVLHHLPETMQETAIQEMCRVLRPGGRLVLVEWQQPNSILRALASPMFLVYMLHNFRSSGSPFDRLGIEARLRELGLENVDRYSFGAGAVGAVVGTAKVSA